MRFLLVGAVAVFGTVVIGAQPVAAQPETWCARISWMNRNICGTVEDFERLAKSTCLQMEAQEHTTTAESITLASNCLAAKITAGKVQLTAEAARKRHERAIAAQEELERLRREQNAGFQGSMRALETPKSGATNPNSHQFDATITPSKPKEGDPNLPRWRKTHEPSG
jgi:hypothetical protein